MYHSREEPATTTSDLNEKMEQVRFVSTLDHSSAASMGTSTTSTTIQMVMSSTESETTQIPPKNQPNGVVSSAISKFMNGRVTRRNDHSEEHNEHHLIIDGSSSSSNHHQQIQPSERQQEQHIQLQLQQQQQQHQQYDMVYFLQKIVADLNKSFDPNEVKDDRLRSLLLAEIIECQRNLVHQAVRASSANKNKNSANSSSSTSTSILKNNNSNNNANRNIISNNLGNITLTQERIYDEWKVLAMVVDRICFFLYIFLLILMAALIYFFNWLT